MSDGAKESQGEEALEGSASVPARRSTAEELVGVEGVVELSEKRALQRRGGKRIRRNESTS